MPYANLHIPTLVRQLEDEDGKLSYLVRPLFWHHPATIAPRYERAVAQFKKEIRGYFKGYQLTRSNAPSLLWYMFRPEVHYQQLEIAGNLAGKFVTGKFAVAHFELQGLTFISLPAFDNYMFIGRKNDRQKVDVEAQAKAQIQRLAKQYKRDDEETYDIENYKIPRREFVTDTRLEVRIGEGKFKLEQEQMGWWFAMMNKQNDFEGGVEIEKVGTAINRLTDEELGRAYLQEDLVEQLENILFKHENTPVVLVGKMGVGKHSVVHQAVRNYKEKQGLKDEVTHEHVWHLDPTRVISGMSIVGQWEQRFEAILEFVKEPLQGQKRRDKLLIDNPVALQRIGRSASSKLTLGNVLKPYLEKREIQLLIVATPAQWKVVQEQDRSFADLFQVIRMAEPTNEHAVKIVLNQRRDLERYTNATISVKAVHQLFTLQRNYLKNHAMPGAVMKMLRQLVTRYKGSPIDAPEVRLEFQDLSGYKEQIFDDNDFFAGDQVQEAIAAKLVGQPEAVKALTDLIHTVKSKLTDKTKPLGSFLFIGPTGVGKTQAAKELCRFLMGNIDRLIRFDMNEYIDAGAVSRLIGNFSNPEGQLTGKVRYQPFGVILLDEIEKAHPKVHDLLLQVLDDGRLTDHIGRTVDFTNTIIIMTSNVGAREVSTSLGFGENASDDAAIYRRAVERTFRPEFINRIDRITIFNPLELEHILGIARLQIRELLRRDGFVRRTTILNIEKEALEWVAKRGYNKRMGGRALKRQIERDLTALSADQLVSSYSDMPIIMDVLLLDDQLVPKITPLEFVKSIGDKWLPKLPEIEKGRGFYNRLIRKIEDLEVKIKQLEENDIDEDIVPVSATNWQHYDFKNRVAEIKEELKTMSLGFRDPRFIKIPATPLRLKSTNFMPRSLNWNRAERRNAQDRLFQEEGLAEIAEAYELGMAQFNSAETEFIDHYLNVEYLLVAVKGFLKGQTERITLSFESAVTGEGAEFVALLKAQYIDFFEEMEITFETEKDHNSIQVEGYGVLDMLGGELGVHLFSLAHKSPIPILVKAKEGDETHPPVLLKVVRISDGKTITDLRTGFTNAVRLSTRELKLLMYAGF